MLFIGLLGLLLIVIAWAASLTSPPPPLRLTVLYLLGSLLLTLYSILIGDPIFTVLNSMATVLALINVVRRVRSCLRGVEVN